MVSITTITDMAKHTGTDTTTVMVIHMATDIATDMVVTIMDHITTVTCIIMRPDFIPNYMVQRLVN